MDSSSPAYSMLTTCATNQSTHPWFLLRNALKRMGGLIEWIEWKRKEQQQKNSKTLAAVTASCFGTIEARRGTVKRDLALKCSVCVTIMIKKVIDWFVSI